MAIHRALNTFGQILIAMLLKMNDFSYELPDHRIAKYPLPERDQSKLLVYKGGEIVHSRFFKIVDYLPPHSTLYFNDTKVIPARLHFQKDTGAVIEIFLLNPVAPSTLLQQAMTVTHHTQWQCTIGNLKRWPDGTTLIKTVGEITIHATLIDRAAGIVELRWTPEPLTFSEVITKAGTVPLPPYLHREAEESDKQTYQTIYSRNEGAVAAPTAGLHFTNPVLNSLLKNGHQLQHITLHVSAGTFQPVKTENAADHSMHQEQIVITKENVESLLSAPVKVAVGTTALRTLESLYWFGVKLKSDPEAPFRVTQQDPYRLTQTITLHDSIEEVVKLFTRLKTDTIIGETAIYIVPGYNFKVVDVLITNFHQPASTLILLVAAFVGSDWRIIYDSALKMDYRFLSYGDSSVLFRTPSL
jgi:S-adenosylmethionine:tRNA ribosyltransferase-isomerase